MKLTRTPSGFLPCREILEFLHAYLDDDLEAEERREFDRHLAVCPSCVAYLDTFRTTVELGRHAFDEGRSAASPALDAPPPPLPEDLVAAILAVRG
ncbi:MAG: zf-HC2 domain-containing protein [Holophagales bacterium]|nr:MAG: zf-HC2 domain-containing protein [Holophagales bacterium]